MKFRSEQGMLAEALGALSRIATSRNSSSPALAGVKLQLNDDTLVASSTDNDISLQFTLSVGGERNGQALISARLLNDIVRALPNGKLTVDVGADSATLSAGRSQFTVPTLNAIEFPRTSPAPANPVTMSAKDLSFALNQVVRAASRDLGKQHLTAVLLRAEDTGLRLVATDSYRLAVRDIVGTSVLGFGQEFLLPSRALGELQRLLDANEEISIRFGDIEATFETPTMQLTTRIINATFPQFKQLILPKYDNKLIVAREALVEALRRSKVLAHDNTTPVRLTMGENGLRITVQTTDQGASTEDVDATFQGTEITAAFNADYLLDGVDATVGEEVSIESTEPNKPAVIRGVGDDSYLYLLMPQRV